MKCSLGHRLPIVGVVVGLVAWGAGIPARAAETPLVGAPLARFGLDAIESVAFAPDGATFLTGCDDGSIFVWDARTGAMLRRLEGHVGAVRAIAFAPDGTRIVTAGEDRTAKLWDAAGGALLATLEGHSAAVTCVAIAADGARVMTGAADGSVRVWNAADGALLSTVSLPDGAVPAAFSPGGERVLTGIGSLAVRVWSTRDGAPIRVYEHPYVVQAAAFAPEGGRLLTGSSDGSVYLWDAEGHVLRTTTLHRDAVTCTAWAPDGSRFLSGSRDRSVILWTAAEGRRLLDIAGSGRPNNAIERALFTPDGGSVLTVAADGVPRLWNAATGAPMRAFEPHREKFVPGLISAAAISPDGKRVLIGGPRAALRLWDAASGLLLRSLPVPAAVQSAAFSPDGASILSCCENLIVQRWDVATGALIETLDVPNSMRGGLNGFSALLPAWVRHVGLGRLPELRELESLADIASHQPARRGSAVFSADGARVLISAEGSAPALWDVASRRVLHAFELPEGSRRGAEGTSAPNPSATLPRQVDLGAMSPDGSLALGMDFTRVFLWHVPTGRLLRSITPGVAGAAVNAFTPNGTYILTGSDSRKPWIRFWSLATGEPVAALALLRPANAVAVSPDSKFLLTVHGPTAELREIPSGADLLGG